jgi:hypothetical protein
MVISGQQDLMQMEDDAVNDDEQINGSMETGSFNVLSNLVVQ